MIYELLVLFHNGGQSSQVECCGGGWEILREPLFRADVDLGICHNAEQRSRKEDTFN